MVRKRTGMERTFANYEKEFPELAEQLKTALADTLPQGWDRQIPVYEEGSSLASRASSGEVINSISKELPFLVGGSADLAGSNNTMIKGGKDFTPETPEGRNIWFGVREFAMGAALNGIALHGD